MQARAGVELVRHARTQARAGELAHRAGIDLAAIGVGLERRLLHARAPVGAETAAQVARLVADRPGHGLERIAGGVFDEGAVVPVVGKRAAVAHARDPVVAAAPART
jgi:hypothetical protein